MEHCQRTGWNCINKTVRYSVILVNNQCRSEGGGQQNHYVSFWKISKGSKSPDYSVLPLDFVYIILFLN